eukprot:Clim_evm22s150 gene=Clim_evmTU22s150
MPPKQKKAKKKSQTAGSPSKEPLPSEDGTKISSERQDWGMTWYTYGIAVVIAAYFTRILWNLVEAHKFYSHLTLQQRELSMYSEQGFYYSFYKHAALEGWSSIHSHFLANDRVEAPNTINALYRFNVYQELILGLSYHYCRELLNDIDMVTFYYGFIFALNGVGIAMLFLCSTSAGRSIWAGLLTVSIYWLNLKHVSRVHHVPDGRESFGVPLMWMQLFSIAQILRKPEPFKASTANKLGLVGTTVAFLLSWQLAPLILLLQGCALFGAYLLRAIPMMHYRDITGGIIIACAIVTWMMYNNPYTIESPGFVYIVAITIMSTLGDVLFAVKRTLYNPDLHVILRVMSAAVLINVSFIIAIAFRFIIGVLNGNELSLDEHIGHFIMTKVGGERYATFHTKLYSCQPAFQALKMADLWELSDTLLVPVALFGVVSVLFFAIRDWVRAKYPEDVTVCSVFPHRIPAELTMHAILTLLFFTSTLFISRFRALMGPAFALMAGQVFYPDATWLDTVSSSRTKLFICIAGIAVMLRIGLPRTNAFMNKELEWHDDGLVSLATWINENTDPDAILAGAMSVLGPLCGHTLRRTANHAHYEHPDIRERTEKIYQIYSDAPPEKVHSLLSEYDVDYLIVDMAMVRAKAPKGCSRKEIAALSTYSVQTPGAPGFLSALDTSGGGKWFQVGHRNKRYVAYKVLQDGG